jgi:uncharacterized RDD family membrane protein YckC
MNEGELLSVPAEARSHQGTCAGVVTRLGAGIVDALAVVAAVVGSYAAWAALRFFVSPRGFTMPAPEARWLVAAFFSYLVVYLTLAWWLAGRSLGDHVWGVRVVTSRGERLGLVRAFARAVVCAAFPGGLLWCALDRDRRAVHDVLLRTSVVYDWLPHPSTPGPASQGAA